MTDFYHWPGFLGTKALFGADITLVLVLLSSTLFTIGWQLALRRKYEWHRWVQTSAAAINALVVVAVMIGSFWGFVLPEIPDKLAQASIWVTTVHAAIGMVAFLLGVFIVLRANGLVPKPLRFKNYKLFMRTSYILYMMSTLIGVIVYLVMYL